MLKLAVIGACGRMGQRIVALAQESPAFEAVGAIEYAEHDLIGRDVGMIAGIGPIDLAVTTEPLVKPDVMIDFTTPDSTEKWAQYARDNGVALVVGTTALSDAQQQLLADVGKTTPVLFAPNMSLGMNLLFKLVGQVATALGDDYDIEIVETHHRFKKDAPSGTAKELARQTAAAKGWPYPDCMDLGRSGDQAVRQDNTIGMHAVRSGAIVGEHVVSFGSLGETVEIRHTAHTRDTFVRGALHGAEWLCKQKLGLYSMADVLGL